MKLQKEPSSRPSMGMAWLILAVMILVVAVAAFLLWGIWTSTPTQRVQMTWDVLKTEKLSFLATQKQEWQANLGSTKAAWYGIEESQGTILADVFYGFDMSELSQEDVYQEQDGTVVIRFPSPRILTLSLRPETYSSVTKRTGLMFLRGLVEDQDRELQQRLGSLKQEVLLDMLQKKELPIQELEEGILQFLDPIFQKQGIPYRIEFPEQKPQKMILDFMKTTT
ncbi:MAG: DUF4230 domain-containing protein [Oligosphaeraceae bacterium]